MNLLGTPAEYDQRAEALQSIRDSVGVLAPKGADLQRIRKLRFTQTGFGRDAFSLMGEMGWIALLVAEDRGGVGLGLGELCAVCEELGAGLAPEPLIPASVSAWLLADCGAHALLEDVLAGRRLLVTAWQEAAGTLDAPGGADMPGGAVATRRFVPFAGAADGFLIPLRREGRIDLVLCPADAAQIACSATQDGGHYGAVRADLRRCQTVGRDIGAMLADVLDRAALASAAYLVGVMEAAFAMTLDYLRNRRQFDRPIGSFQALQHRAVDHRIRIELSRASLNSAAAALDAGAPQVQRRMAVSRAKVSASDSALLITRQAVQMHGAIGFTDEFDVGLHLRKAMVVAGQFGSAQYHRRRFFDLEWQEAQADEAGCAADEGNGELP